MRTPADFLADLAGKLGPWVREPSSQKNLSDAINRAIETYQANRRNIVSSVRGSEATQFSDLPPVEVPEDAGVATRAVGLVSSAWNCARFFTANYVVDNLLSDSAAKLKETFKKIDGTNALNVFLYFKDSEMGRGWETARTAGRISLKTYIMHSVALAYLANDTDLLAEYKRLSNTPNELDDGYFLREHDQARNLYLMTVGAQSSALTLKK